MINYAIKVENLSKLYLIGHTQKRHDTLRDALVDGFKAPFERLRNSKSEIRNSEDTIWALKNISIEIQPGEVMGIIGRNGAGKTTLLKILSRITEPTTGRAVINGRVGSLLEVGTGFHPELTGRENIYLNGAILGMTRKEIDQKFEEIVDFAEIEKFLDTPVKRYSSGMYVRLAFAVAAHLEPEILLVDEVLAVGDSQFQKKCLGKMGDVARKGRTVLLVSHNMAAIQSLCQSTIWIHLGKIARLGETTSVINDYLSLGASHLREKTWEDIEKAPGNEYIKFHRICLRLQENSQQDEITIRTPFALEFEFWNLKPGTILNLSVHLYNDKGIMVLNTFPMYENTWFGKPHPAGLFRSKCFFPGDFLNDGIHRVSVMAVKDQGVVLCNLEDILVFDVHDSQDRRPNWFGNWQGAVRPILLWQTELLQNL